MLIIRSELPKRRGQVFEFYVAKFQRLFINLHILLYKTVNFIVKFQCVVEFTIFNLK